MEFNLTTIPDHAIVEILNGDKERMFYKEVMLKSGKSIKLTLDIPIGGNYDGHFSQGVSIARIVALGEGVTGMQPGDEVIVDYTIDTDGAKIISNENGKKLVRAAATNKFYKENSALISATNESKYEAYEHKKGDVEQVATIFGVIKGNEIIPNWPYVFLKYVDVAGEFEETESGLIIPSSEGEMVIRQVLFANPDSPMKPGDNVVVDFAALYERQVNEELLSICMQDDIVGRIVE